MPSAELSRRVQKLVGYAPLSELGDPQRREFHEAPLEADSSKVCLGSGKRPSWQRNRTGRSCVLWPAIQATS
jgi:hypothetical protein